MNLIEFGDCRETMRRWAEQGVKAQMCVTSPPYFGLRSYLPDDSPDKPMEIGLEQTPEQYIAAMVEVFRCVRDVLADDGTLWVNIGDSYASGGRAYRAPDSKDGKNGRVTGSYRPADPEGIKPKDLIGIPWMLAFALRADGWYLRQDIIWHKCLSGGAWLYARTQKGDMPVMLKDLVRLRPESVQLWNGTAWTQVVSWSRSESQAEKIELVLRSGERVGCTGDHRWPTTRGLVEASELRVGDCLIHAVLPDSPLQAPGYLADDVAWLAGLYLAEGSRADDTVQLSLHADEMPWLSRIESAAAHLGAAMTFTRKGKNLSVRLYGAVLRAALDSIIGGRTAIDKHLRAEAWRLPNRTLRAIARGYLDGDGHADPKNDRIRLGFCRNYAMERDLRTLAARLGATITLKPTTSRYQGGERPSFRGEWRWARNGHHNERDRGEIVEIRRSRARQFWDVSVADEPHLFALASGLLTHNSNPMPESVKDRCTKAHEYVFLLSKSERYFFDSEAIKEPAVTAGDTRHLRRDKTADARLSPSGREKNGKPQAETRNRRSVWTVVTKPYNGKKALTDYVGDDGKPYTASPDCPIHGHLARRQTSGTHGYGGQQGQSQTGSAGTCAHHAQSPVCGEQSTTSRSSQASGAGNSRQHTPESSHENKTDSRLSGHTSGDGNQSCSGCKSASGEHQDCGKDCSHQSSSSTATSHNTGTSKTARAPATIRPCMPCAETDNRTQSTSDQRGLFEQDHGISESSILTGETSVHPSQDTHICNAGTSSELVSMAYEVGEKCTCNEVIIDHFATFPPALIEPCILAGSRPGDIVLDPFMGSGTTAAVAIEHGRQYLGCELNPEYGPLQQERIAKATPEPIVQQSLFQPEAA